MTSASLGSWAGDGLKVLLGPDSRSLLDPPCTSTQRSRRIAGLQAGAVGPGRYLRPIRPPVRSKVPRGNEMPAAPPGHAAVPRRRDSTGDVVSGGSLATVLGCARPGRKGAREHLLEKITTRHKGRLEGTHDAASPGAHRRRIGGAGLAAALGCAPAQPSPHLNIHHKVATARRPPIERKARRAHHGVIPGSVGKRSARRPAVRSTRRCGLGWPRCWVRNDAACCDGRPWGNGDTAHTAHDGSKTRPQSWSQGFERRKRRGETEVLTTGRRCSRRRLDEGGGAV
jgi:hypothetical protein